MGHAFSLPRVREPWITGHFPGTPPSHRRARWSDAEVSLSNQWAALSGGTITEPACRKVFEQARRISVCQHRRGASGPNSPTIPAKSVCSARLTPSPPGEGAPSWFSTSDRHRHGGAGAAQPSGGGGRVGAVVYLSVGGGEGGIAASERVNHGF